MPDNLPGFTIHADKHVEPHELANLFSSVGWGNEADYRPDTLGRSITAYPLIAYCRDANGLLVGYVSAFTDGVFTTFVGELVIRPEYQRRGVGSALIALVVEKCRGVPIYGISFEDTQDFFLERGFKAPKRNMSVLSMRNP